MQRRSVIGVPTLWILIGLGCLASRALGAETGVPAWERTFRRDPFAVAYQNPIAARELADGSVLVVVQQGLAVTGLRYDHDGNVLGTSTFYPSYGAWKVAIDPFGGIFVAGVPGFGGGAFSPGDLWVAKYDGLSGEPLWSDPPLFGIGDGDDDVPRELFVDPAGDLVAVVVPSTTGHPVSILKYDGRSGAPIWGPVGIGWDVAAAMDGGGNVLLASATGSDLHVVKYASSTGAVLWQHDELGHPVHPKHLSSDARGDVVLVSELDFGDGIESTKYDGATGAFLWGPSLYAPSDADSTRFVAAAVGTDGSVVVEGLTSSANTNTFFLMRLLGRSGSPAWITDFSQGDNQHTYNQSIWLAGNGDAIVNATFQTGQSTADLKTWRFDGGTGGALWGPETLSDAASPVGFVASNGRVFMSTGVFTETSAHTVTLERDGGSGSPVWGPSSFSGLAAGRAHLWDLTAAPDGNVIVTGSAQNPDGNSSFATLKYDRATGNTIWGPVFFDTHIYSTYTPWQTVTDAAGNVFVTGIAYLPDLRLVVVKYDGATGSLLWTSDTLAGIDSRGMAVDASGNPAIVGYSETDVGYDTVVVKLSGADGSVVWGPKVHDGGGDDFPNGVATDAAGNVFVIGFSYGQSGPPGFLLKYAAADGTVLWGPVHPVDTSPASLVVDVSGNVVVAGSGPGGIHVSKYSAASGTSLWGPVVGGIDGSGYGGRLAQDAGGDIFVAGSVSSAATRFDYATFKVRGSDGMLLWGPVLFDGAVHDNDVPYDVRLDGAGNPVVTGRSEWAVKYNSVATLKYDGATGALLWGPVLADIGRGTTVNGLATTGTTVYVGATRAGAYLVTALTESLGIATLPEDVPSAECGQPYDFALLAQNASSPSWSLISGSLPPGMALTPSGHVSGAATQEGIFSFRAQVSDGASAPAARDFTLIAGQGAPYLPIFATAGSACELTLSVAGAYDSYHWLPGGETTPSITVSPSEVTIYGVLLGDGSGCPVRGAIQITPTALIDPACLAPTVLSIAPDSGPAAAGTAVTIAGSNFQAGASVFIGGALAESVTIAPGQITANTPNLAPGTLNDLLVVNLDNGYGFLPGAFATDFLDIPPSDLFHDAVLRVLRNGITAGCGGGYFCRNSNVTRAQMAVFLLKASLGSSYAPPPAIGIFSDVGAGGFAADWIEDLYNRGITGGCATNPLRYCPGNAVTRAQMAVFLLKTEHGSAYAPPACAGVFADVSCTPSPAFAVDWIEQLHAEQVTGGCATAPLRYCPSAPATRGQMAVFLVRMFELP